MRIYDHSPEKFRCLVTVKKRLHGIFHHYPLDRFTFIVNHIDSYISGELLFKHAVGATISSENADLFYLQDFKQLIKINAANVNFENMSHIEAMVKGPCEVASKDDEVEEMFGLAKHLLNREYRITTQVPSNDSRKRFRTPSPVEDKFEGELKRIQLARSRMKHAYYSPISFRPEILLMKFPELDRTYKLVTPSRLYNKEDPSFE